MTIKERIEIFIERQGIKRSVFEKSCGFSNGYTRNLKENPSATKIEDILNAYPELNRVWLLSGEGEMLKAEEADEVPPMVNYEEGVPYYDEDFVLGFSELGFPFSENPQFLVKMPKYRNATLWCRATGHSMEPEIHDNDVIALQLIEDHSFLVYGDIYGIVTTNGLRTIKRIGRSKDPGSYRLIPSNPACDEQDIPKDKILRVFRVLGTLHTF